MKANKAMEALLYPIPYPLYPVFMYRRGFTLIELLITISIIAILAGAIFASIDPRRRLNGARNATRWTHVTLLVDALKAYQAENDGDPPASIDTDPATIQIIGENVTSCSCAAPHLALETPPLTVPSSACGINLNINEMKPFIARIPADPLRDDADAKNDSRYYVNYDANYGIVTVGACDAQSEERGGEGAPKKIDLAR